MIPHSKMWNHIVSMYVSHYIRVLTAVSRFYAGGISFCSDPQRRWYLGVSYSGRQVNVQH